MISALKGYSETEPQPPDAAIVMKTAEYLEAYNLIFEKDILIKKIISSMDIPVIYKIKKGFLSFTDWYNSHQRTGIIIVFSFFFSCCFYQHVYSLHSGMGVINGNKAFMGNPKSWNPESGIRNPELRMMTGKFT